MDTLYSRSEATQTEAHHRRVPSCLLWLWNRAEAHPEPLSGEGIQFWLDFEAEALRSGVDPDVSSEELQALVEASTVEFPRNDHRERHTEDFAAAGSA